MLESRVTQTQMANEAKLAKQKAIFEQKLKVQEEQNRGIITANDGISKSIQTLKRENAELKNHDIAVEENNRFMRKELQALLSKIGAAQGFLTSSLSATDDSGAQELAVLNLKNGHHRHQALFEVRSSDSDDREGGAEADDDGDDVDEAAASFLALRSRVSHPLAMEKDDEAEEGQEADGAPDAAAGAEPATPADPRDLVSTLTRGVARLQQEGRESQRNLKAMFISAFQAGAKRHAALLQQQRALTATRDALQATKAKLEAAERHLEATRRELEQRLRGLGLFLQKVAHFALAPTAEASKMLSSLPAKVSLAQVPSRRAA